MIAVALALISASTSMGAPDATRAPREAFTRCLRLFVDTSVRAQKTLEQFDAEFAQACPGEQAALRQAIVAREMANGQRRADGEQAANLEVEDARANFSDIFQMSLPPTPVANTPPAH